MKPMRFTYMSFIIWTVGACGGLVSNAADDGGTYQPGRFEGGTTDGGAINVAADVDAPLVDGSTADSASCPPLEVKCVSSCVDVQTDSNNCGTCGNACFGACQAGTCARPVTLVDNELEPVCLAIDANNIYWANYGDGAIRKISKGGGQPITLTSSPDTYPWDIAVDAQNVYWTLPNFFSGGLNTAVMKIPVGGGSPVALVTDPVAPFHLAVGSTNVYWTVDGDDYPTRDAVLSVPITGGSVMPMATADYGAGAIAADANNLYWVSDSATFMTPLGGGSSIAIGPVAAALAVDETYVYYSVNDGSAGTGSIVRAPIGGGEQAVLASGRPGLLEAIAVDDANVYWIEGVGTIGMAELARLSKQSGTVAVLATGTYAPAAIAVDDTFVYFAIGAVDQGAIEKIAK